MQDNDLESPKNEKEELKGISIRIPIDLHKKAQYHRVETGESMTQLIVRLLREELG